MIQWIERSVRFALRLLVRLYQLTLSPLLPNCCRFHPCCSQYAMQALREKRLFTALWLIARRLCRCHEFNPGGYDPLP